MAIQTGAQLAQAARQAAGHKTLYVNGCFGAPMNAKNKSRYISGYAYNQRPERQAKIQAASADTFGFDCVCFVKGLLWDWEADAGSIYGGADYAINGVPDITEEALLNKCAGVSEDFSAMYVGEYLWMKGHCGIYIGDGLAVEATPDWADGVQLTAVGNLGAKAGYPTRTWQKHGRLPYVSYEAPEAAKPGTEQVRALQALLILRGYSCGKGFIDGTLGADTQKALAQFAQDNQVSGDMNSQALWGKLIGAV